MHIGQRYFYDWFESDAELKSSCEQSGGSWTTGVPRTQECVAAEMPNILGEYIDAEVRTRCALSRGAQQSQAENAMSACGT